MWYAIDYEFTSSCQFIVEAEDAEQASVKVEKLGSEADDGTFMQSGIVMKQVATGDTEEALYDALNDC